MAINFVSKTILKLMFHILKLKLILKTLSMYAKKACAHAAKSDSLLISNKNH